MAKWSGSYATTSRFKGPMCKLFASCSQLRPVDFERNALNSKFDCFIQPDQHQGFTEISRVPFGSQHPDEVNLVSGALGREDGSPVMCDRGKGAGARP